MTNLQFVYRCLGFYLALDPFDGKYRFVIENDLNYLILSASLSFWLKSLQNFLNNQQNENVFHIFHIAHDYIFMNLIKPD